MALFRRRGLFSSSRDPIVGGSRSGFGGGGGYWLLTPPSWLAFVVSIVLAAAAFLIRYAHVDIPIVEASHVFDVLAIGYVVLLAGVLLPRL